MSVLTTIFYLFFNEWRVVDMTLTKPPTQPTNQPTNQLNLTVVAEHEQQRGYQI